MVCFLLLHGRFVDELGEEIFIQKFPLYGTRLSIPSRPLFQIRCAYSLRIFSNCAAREDADKKWKFSSRQFFSCETFSLDLKLKKILQASLEEKPHNKFWSELHYLTKGLAHERGLLKIVRAINQFTQQHHRSVSRMKINWDKALLFCCCCCYRCIRTIIK